MKIKIGLILLLICAAVLLANCSQPAASARNFGAASLSMQITPVPPVEDQSRIGSTNGILVAGVVIVLITSIPIFLHRKKK